MTLTLVATSGYKNEPKSAFFPRMLSKRNHAVTCSEASYIEMMFINVNYIKAWKSQWVDYGPLLYLLLHGSRIWGATKHLVLKPKMIKLVILQKVKYQKINSNLVMFIKWLISINPACFGCSIHFVTMTKKHFLEDRSWASHWQWQHINFLLLSQNINKSYNNYLLIWPSVVSD